MKKSFLLKFFLFLFLLPAFAMTLGDWKSFQLTESFSIEFPEEPKESEMSGNRVWIADPNSDSRCMVMLMDFAKYGMDSASLANEFNTDEGYTSFRDGILTQIDGSKIISEKKMKVKGYTTFDFVIDMGKTGSESLNVFYSRSIFVGTRMYNVNFYEKNGKPLPDIRNKFFQSVKLK